LHGKDRGAFKYEVPYFESGIKILGRDTPALGNVPAKFFDKLIGGQLKKGYFALWAVEWLFALEKSRWKFC
jgi:hypothetical protein